MHNNLTIYPFKSLFFQERVKLLVQNAIRAIMSKIRELRERKDKREYYDKLCRQQSCMQEKLNV